MTVVCRNKNLKAEIINNLCIQFAMLDIKTILTHIKASFHHHNIRNRQQKNISLKAPCLTVTCQLILN